MVGCEEVEKIIRTISLVKGCDTVKSGALRLMTPFTYPDGSNIDVFVRPIQVVLGSAGEIELTDYGQTIAWLSNLQIRPTATKKRRQIVEDICIDLGLIFDGWQIKTPIIHLEEIPEFIISLSQSCIRVADLMFTQRLQSASTLRDDVEEFVSDLEVPYEQDVELPGRRGNIIRLDFSVTGKRHRNLVQLLASGSHISAIEVFSRWYEIAALKESSQFLTIYDDRESEHIRNEDLDRIGDFSIVLPWQDRSGIQELLVA